MTAEFLGSGWAFPLRPDAGGGLGYTSGEANIEQSLRILVQTTLGERVMRPRFGTRARELVFAPGSVQHLRLLETTLQEAVRDYEPRVAVEGVRAEPDRDDETRVIVDLAYRVRQTNTRLNLVFPYYLGVTGAGP
jgi:phage baseplate assembly protein W